MPVNPKHREIAGQRCYPDVASLPAVPDLAVICTPPETVPDLISALGARGTRGAIVITAGFRELGSDRGAVLERAMLDAARPYLMRIIGPNCVGVLSTPIGLNASFAPSNAIKGGVAFIAQSGAMVTTVLDWASAAASASRILCRSATWPTSISATCWTISPTIRQRRPSCSTSRP